MRSGLANAARLTGEVQLGGGVRIAETPSFNGAKLLPIEPVALRRGERIEFLLGSGSLRGASLAEWRCLRAVCKSEQGTT
jgi:hypothetical protein